MRVFFRAGGAAAVLVALLFVACGWPGGEAASRGSGGTEQQQGSPAAAPDDVPPAGAENEFQTDFGKHSVSYKEVLCGGPPKDGIPAIDEPRFVGVGEAGAWLEPQEPVILLQVADEVRAYPIQIVMWHEIVNDTVGGVPVAVTFCPPCNTAIAFERTVDGQELTFGTTGRLQLLRPDHVRPPDRELVAAGHGRRHRRSARRHPA